MKEISVFALVFAILALAGGFGEPDNHMIYSGKLESVTYLQSR